MPDDLNDLLENYKQCYETIIEKGSSRNKSNRCRHKAHKLASQLTAKLDESCALDKTTQDLAQQCVPATRAFDHHGLLYALVKKTPQLDSTTLIDNTALSKLAGAQQRYENNASNHIELGGICLGISMMLRNAFFTQSGLDIFQKRLEKLVNDYDDYYKQGLLSQPDQIQSLEEYYDQQAHHSRVIPSQADYVDLMIFFNQLRVYQRPDLFYIPTDSLGTVTQNGNPLDKTLQPVELSNDPINNIATLLVKEPDQATFDELIAQAQQSHIDQLSCVVGIEAVGKQTICGHAIFIGYDNYNDSDQPWLFMDINRMPIKRGKTQDIVDEAHQTLASLPFDESDYYWVIHIATQQSQQKHIAKLQNWIQSRNQGLFKELSSGQRMLLVLSVCKQITKLDEESSQKLIQSLDLATVKACPRQFYSAIVTQAMDGNNMPASLIRQLLERLCSLAQIYPQETVYLRLEDFDSLAYIDRALLHQVYLHGLLPVNRYISSDSEFMKVYIRKLLKEASQNPSYQMQALNNLQDLLFYYDITLSVQDESDLFEFAEKLKIDEPQISHSEFIDLLKNKFTQYQVYKQFANHQASLQQLLSAYSNYDPHSLVAIQHPQTGESMLHVAAKKGDDKAVEQLIETYNLKLNANNPAQVTPLHLAAQNGHQHIVIKLCDYFDANINQACVGGMTALHLAAENGHLPIIQTLVNQAEQSGYTPLINDHQGQTALDYAKHHLTEHNCEVISYLQQVSLDLTGPSNESRHNTDNQQLDQNQLLQIAAYFGFKELTTKLHAQGYDLNCRVGNGNTPLHMALLNNNNDLAEQLIQKDDVDSNLKNNQRQTSVHIAIQQGQKQLVKQLCDRDDFDRTIKQGSIGDTLLHYAIRYSQFDIAHMLIDIYDFDTAATNKRGEVPLHLLCSQSDTDHTGLIEKLCTQNSINTTMSIVAKETPLHIAVKQSQSEVVKTLLNKGADPTIKNADRKTPRDLANDAIRAIFNQHMTIMAQYKTDIKPSQGLSLYSNPSQEADLKQSEFTISSSKCLN